MKKNELECLKHLLSKPGVCGLNDTDLNDIVKCRKLVEERINEVKEHPEEDLRGMNRPTHAILFKNNWDGEGDLEHRFIYYKDGVPIDYDTDRQLIEYVGDEIIKQWELK